MGDRQSSETSANPIDSRSTLEGVLERIVFFNEENSFTVARLQVPGKKDLVTIVGALSLPTP
jgi:exodeoxyribonuclease V alpha subunit